MIEVIPAILEKDFSEVVKKIQRLEKEAPEAHWAQLDIMDGRFVPNTTWQEPRDMAKLTTRLNFEVHFMIEHPQDFVGSWLKRDHIRRVLFHREALDDDDLVKSLVLVKEQNREVGIALNPKTSLDTVRNHLVLVDEVLFMGVEPGFSGQRFLTGVLNKIRALRQMHPRIEIGIDGGVTEHNARAIIAAGATRLCAASLIWNSPDIGLRIKSLEYISKIVPLEMLKLQ